MSEPNNAGGDYDALNAQGQALIRAIWAERIDRTRRDLRLDRLLIAQGREVVELGDDGDVVVRNPGGCKSKRAAR